MDIDNFPCYCLFYIFPAKKTSLCKYLIKMLKSYVIEQVGEVVDIMRVNVEKVRSVYNLVNIEKASLVYY